MSGIKIPVGVAFDAGAEQRLVEEFTDKFNKMGQAIAEAGKKKFQPIDRATLDDIRRAQSGFESLKKISGDLTKRMKATGQGGAGLFDIDWSKLYPDQHARRRQMEKVFEYVNGGSRMSAVPPAPPTPPRPGGRNGGRTPNMPPDPWRRQGRNIVGTGLGAMGPVGQVANNALSAGMAGGVGAGIAGLAGGLAALGIGKAIGAVREKIGAAQQEYIGYDTLKRQLGDVNVGFHSLKDSLRMAAAGLDMTFEEGQRLGSQFTKLAGISGEQYKTLADEVRNAGGFGRSFGVDPSQSNAFFAQMRQYHVTSNVEDSRRLGLLIGEGVAKSGAFSKVDEVLEAIAGYAQQQTRMGMNAANVGGYTGMLAGMVGSGIPGMDPTSASMMLGRVNSAIAGGGGGGEAGQNFIYRALGTNLGLDPIQTAILREQGAFGTGAGTFGEGSTWERFAKMYPKARGTGTAATSTATNLEMIMQQFKDRYANDPELMVNAMSSLFGVNNSQAMALSTIKPEQLGGLATRLQRMGVNINDVNSTGISRMAQLHASGASDAELKAAATQNQEETDGTKTRASINGVERAIQEQSSKMISLMNDMREGIMYMAGGKDGKSRRQMAEANMRAESRDRSDQINADFDGRLSRGNTVVDMAHSRLEKAKTDFERNRPNMTKQQREAALKELEDLRLSEAAAIKHVGEVQDERVKKLKEESNALEKNVDTMKNAPDGAGAGRGSVNPPLAADVGVGGSRSWRNNNPGNIKFNKFSQALGATGQDADGFAIFPSAEVGRSAQEKLLFDGANYKDLTLADAVKRWAPSSDGNDPSGYAKNLLGAVGGRNKRMSDYTPDERARILDAQQRQEGWRPGRSDLETATPLPGGARPTDTAGGGRTAVDVSGVFNLIGPSGQPMAAPVQVATRVNVPMPSGLA